MTWREFMGLLLAWLWCPAWTAWQRTMLLNMHVDLRTMQEPQLAQTTAAAQATGQLVGLPTTPWHVQALGILTWVLYVLAVLSPLLVWPSFRQRGGWPFKSAYLTGLAALALFSVFWFGSMHAPIGW